VKRRPKYLALQFTRLCVAVSAKRGLRGLAANIKLHRNVGGLPAWLDFELIEPLRDLFKDEVRGVNRVVYDISSKPPATIEWEQFFVLRDAHQLKESLLNGLIQKSIIPLSVSVHLTLYRDCPPLSANRDFKTALRFFSVGLKLKIALHRLLVIVYKQVESCKVKGRNHEK